MLSPYTGSPAEAEVLLALAPEASEYGLLEDERLLAGLELLSDGCEEESPEDAELLLEDELLDEDAEALLELSSSEKSMSSLGEASLG